MDHRAVFHCGRGAVSWSGGLVGGPLAAECKEAGEGTVRSEGQPAAARTASALTSSPHCSA
jgi:hypothetical protein